LDRSAHRSPPYCALFLDQLKTRFLFAFILDLLRKEAMKHLLSHHDEVEGLRELAEGLQQIGRKEVDGHDVIAVPQDLVIETIGCDELSLL
jgi:hypothetical protein